MNEIAIDEQAAYDDYRRRHPDLLTYHEQCAAYIAHQINGKRLSEPPAILELATPPPSIDYDEDEVREIWRGFFRRQYQREIEFRFVTHTLRKSSRPCENSVR